MASYLQIENISKSYGPKVLFEKIGFNINEGDKIALIAPNGTGKTSLMRILAGKDKSDSGGKIMFLKDIRIAFLEQEYPFDPEKSIFEQRDQVFLTLDVKDSEGKPASGSFSMTVTDNNLVKLNPSAPNILSYMLLSSDLKGDVEEAGYYFIDNSESRMAHLDLVMMTNGFGATIGTLAAQAIVNHFVNAESVIAQGPMAIWQGWQTSWYIFAGFALVVALAFWVIFPKTPVKQ